MKRFIVIILSVVMIMSAMTACKNSNDKVEIVTGAATIADYDATVYLVDSWREDSNEGTKTYYTTLLMYSEDFYDAPTVDDIKYKTDDGYEELTNVIDGASIVIYDVNNQPVNGVCTYAKIKTSTLIDMKKIYVYFAGPSSYNPNTLTAESYKEANGSLDGWAEMLSNVTERGAPNGEVAKLQTDAYRGVIRFTDDYGSLFYYEPSGENAITEGHRLLTKIDVDQLKEHPVDMFVSNIVNYGTAVNLSNGNFEETELDERLRIAGEVIDGEVWIGFETVDGSDFSAYDGEVPDAIVYHTVKAYGFVIVDN